MGHTPAQRMVAAFLIYILTSAPLWAADCGPPEYNFGAIGGLLNQRFPDLITCSIDRLFGEWKDWVVGFWAGLIAGLIIIFLLHWQVPKIGISKNIAITRNTPGSGEHQAIKVINRRRTWPFFKRSAIDLRAELHVVLRDEGGPEGVKLIELVRHDPLIIPPRQPRRSRQPAISDYIFRIKRINGKEPDLEVELESAVGIRFRLYARDSFSNYGAVFTQYYYSPENRTGQLRQPSRWWRKDERPYGPIARGYWPIGSLDFRPYTSRSARPQSEEAEPNSRSIAEQRAQLEIVRVMMASLQERLADKDGVIDDLRQRLNREGEERRNLTAALTDQLARVHITPMPETAASGQLLLWAFAAMTLFAWLARGWLVIRRPLTGPSEPPRAANRKPVSLRGAA